MIADETANPRFVAADLLSQAEHDELASAILVTTSEDMANAVNKEIEGFLKVLSRSEIIKKSLEDYWTHSYWPKIWRKRSRQPMRLHLSILRS